MKHVVVALFGYISTTASAFCTSSSDCRRTPKTTSILYETIESTQTVLEEKVASAEENTDEADNVFEMIAGRAAICLFESDLRRDAIGKGAGIAASSATNWINDASAFALQKSMDKLKLTLPEECTNNADRDTALSWIRWMKSTPAPTIIDLSQEFQTIVNASLPQRSFDMMEQTRDEFLTRIGCRLILLPSGAELSSSLTEPPSSLIYGKLLYGGATRYRLIVSSTSNAAPRRAGIRTEVKTTAKDSTPVWIMYGGPSRMYEAVDMGAAAVLEVVLLPRGKSLSSEAMGRNMIISGMVWRPQNMFSFLDPDVSDHNLEQTVVNGYTPASLSGKERNDAFRSDFRSSLGGLQPQIDAIVRRVLDGRVIRPADALGENLTQRIDGDQSLPSPLANTALEAEELSLLGLTPVRGLLLYGPPGCGKTALAREISKALNARAPKIASAPELLDRWVGGSEKLVRSLFADAEAELAACNGDATRSALHVIVIDEIDAVFRKRSSAEDSGEATRSSVVNQILSKLDGVNAIPNVLLIGMTNRRELLDEALLRPGRLEVQIEIPLPNKQGRREILQIHFDALRRKGRLSQPLCSAIDGGMATRGQHMSEFETLESASNGKRVRFRKALKKAFHQLPSFTIPTVDLAADYATGGFSGADIAGLVRCAGSLALARCRKDGTGVDGLLITLDDVKQALQEVKR